MPLAKFFCAGLSLCLCGALTSCGNKTITENISPTYFYGMCDASAAVPLTDNLFAVADDEDNVLRIYNAAGGKTVASYDLSPSLGLDPIPSKSPDKPAKAPPELDIEGAAIYREHAYWITSHGRNSSGKFKQERLRFFATTLGSAETNLTLAGKAYDQLLTDLIEDAELKPFNLATAAELAPKAMGGLNIEALSVRKEGGLWIGFRNPIPNELALLVPLLNPEQVINGSKPELGKPVLLDLGGRGIRAITVWRGNYVIAAGAYDQGLDSRIYLWDGIKQPEEVPLDLATITNPEAFFAAETRDQVMLLNDQGTVLIDGQECKKLKDHTRKYFTGNWIKLL